MNGVSPGGFNVISSFLAQDGGVMACQPPELDANGDPIMCPHTSEFQSTTPGTVLKVSQSPSVLNMSSGDTNKSISVTVAPSGASVNLAFSLGLTGNPNSNSTASVSIPGNNSASGTASYTIGVSGTSASPSGIFGATACGSGACSSQGTTITVPPQVLIQVLYGEAHGQTGIGDTVTQPAIGSAIKNRFGRPEFPGGTASTYQAVIISSQFAGISTGIITGVEPELDIAAALFNRTQGDTVAGSPCFFSPTSSEWSAIQAALNSGTTTVPSLANDPGCYAKSSPSSQLVYKSSIGNNASGNGAPAFIFERQKPLTTTPAVVQIN